MEVKKVKISQIKLNDKNPRFIKDDAFAELVESLRSFPEMLNIRPIVVNADMMVLGGNMRLRACQELKFKEIPIIIANNLSEEKQREFLIKDNISGGEWDLDMLANEWDIEELENWGLHLKFPIDEEEDEPEPEQTYVPTYKFEVSCNTEKEKNKLMAELLQKGYSCTDDY